MSKPGNQDIQHCDSVSPVTGQIAHPLAKVPAFCLRWSGLISRIVAALLGGYALAALFSVAVLALPISRPEAVLWGMQLAFLVYAGAVVWVFAVRSATRAWVGLVVATLVLLPLALWVWHGAGA